MAGAFKLLVLIHDGETKSYLARHPAFDRTVMLHMLPKPGSAERDVLTSYLTRLPPVAEKMLLEWGEENGAGFLVTDKIVDFRSLRDWLEKVALSPPPPVSPEPEPVAPPPAAPPEPPAVAASEPAEPPARAPGEFTRLFQAVPDTAAPPDPPSQPEAPPPAKPGEFTRLFSPSQSTLAPIPGAAGEPAPSTIQPRQPGAFTKAFQALSESHAPHIPVAPASNQSAGFFDPPLPPAQEEQDLGRPAPRPQDAPARPAFQQAGEFTRMFGNPDPPRSPVESPPPPAPVESGKPPASDAYANMFAAPPEAPPAPAAPTAAPAPAPAPPPKSAPSSNLPIIIILAVLLLAALGLIAYFALKR